MVWNQNSYTQFLKSKIIEEEQYLKDGKNLLGEKLKNEYEELYNQRNKIAHNTLSYQQNLPDFNILKNEKEYSRNYFLWFAILLLIDNIFIREIKEEITIICQIVLIKSLDYDLTELREFLRIKNLRILFFFTKN